MPVALTILWLTQPCDLLLPDPVVCTPGGSWSSNMQMLLLLLCQLLYSLWLLEFCIHMMSRDPYVFIPVDEARKEGTPTRTSRYLRSHQMLEEVRRERASYHKAIPDKKAVVQEYMEEEDKAMKARFEEWMKKYGRTYKDELEKARRFKIFKAAARCADAYNADAAKAGHSARSGLNDFSDWNAQEIAPLHGTPTSRDGGYLRMIMHHLSQQEIWHQMSSVPILSMQ